MRSEELKARPPPTTSGRRWKIREEDWLCLALLSLLLPFPLGGPAQQAGQAPVQDSASVHQGFWLNVGVAGSVRSVDCQPPCGRDPGQGAALTLALCRTVSPRLLLGAEIQAWAPWNSSYFEIGLGCTWHLRMTGSAVSSTGKQADSLESPPPNDLTHAHA